MLSISPEKSSVDDLKPKRVRDLQSILREHLPDTLSSCGASALTFSPDSSKLTIATTTAFVLVLDLVSGSTSARVLRRFDQHRHRGSMADIEEHETKDRGMAGHQPSNAEPVPATVTRMVMSPDGQWLATTDDHLRTHIFNLDSVQHHSSLPSFPQPVHALAFAPSLPSLLILGFANNSLELYDVEARQFPPWSRSLCTALPKRFTHLHDAILGVTLAPADPEKIVNKDSSTSQDVLALFWGATWLCKVQFAAPVGWGGSTDTTGRVYFAWRTRIGRTPTYRCASKSPACLLQAEVWGVLIQLEKSSL